MADGFRRTPQGIAAQFDMMQAGVLRRLASDIEDLMAVRADTATGPEDPAAPAGTSGRADVGPAGGADVPEDPLEALFADFGTETGIRPDDPVLARLLPDGYADPSADSAPPKPSVGGPRDGAPADVPPGGVGPAGVGPADTGSADIEPGAAAEFRRFTEATLRDGKTANARLIRDSLPAGGGAVLLDDDQSASWLSGLNDMRLSLGTALDVGPDTEREYARLDPLSSRARRLYLYFWLGLLQESLLDAIAAD